MNTLHATINERRTQLSHMQQMAETLPLSEERDRVKPHRVSAPVPEVDTKRGVLRMQPLLPANPGTITPERIPLGYGITLSRYAGRALNSATDAQIRTELEELRRFDTYEGKTSELREQTKRALRDVLNRSIRSGW